MSEPITPTAPVTGKDAERIHEEMINGTPLTPERELLFSNARIVFSGLESWLTLEKGNREICFYEGPHYYLSNFSAFAIRVNGVVWMTVEHAYQAAKFPDHPAIQNLIREALSAHEAKQIAKRNKEHTRSDWDEMKYGLMEELLRTKIVEHPYVLKKLLETGESVLVEDSPKDAYWGRGPDWQGQNHLGRLWMKLREELRSS